MKGLSFHQRPRSLGSQQARMASRWPQFQFSQLKGSMVSWEGRVRGFQRPYLIEAFWDATSPDKPYVVLRDPPLKPRDGKAFEDIPHLLFYRERPELSGLCLFDPNGQEWSNKLLIADTTIAWSAEWLLYYELWHLDGVWRGGGVGPENIAEARAATIYRETGELAKEAPGSVALAAQ
ncbi:hypothetical protein P3C58_14830 [Mesorhizobium sp. XAP10]|uniref:hypothetical protein n=1 Tax=unclassified Mesorhizobium TaxID=325217 RepID=UPI0023DFEB5C|nr:MULTISPECIES: hypothetical protein [unclassified Mesorhizobium]MDF3153249.1 hypothetical protein [Mesorhizobium sp. XAP10]MDF3246453.1 hypothetical protein [Mesorhizobium sp. XAP4]